MIFKDGDCKDDSIRIDMNDEGKVFKNISEIYWLGMSNDDADSVMVPPGYELHIWEHDGMEGNLQVMKGLDYDYNGNMVCQNLVNQNQMSSLEYYKTTQNGMPVIGNWLLADFIGGGTQTLTMTTSTSSTDTSMTET
jgi:hypothetical protein